MAKDRCTHGNDRSYHLPLEICFKPSIAALCKGHHILRIQRQRCIEVADGVLHQEKSLLPNWHPEYEQGTVASDWLW